MISTTFTLNGQPMETGNYSRFVGWPICPDLLTHRDLGAADTMRGRLVRAFFWIMRWVP